MSKSFQSTRPRGARRLGQVLANTLYFVSIHAPARGATGFWFYLAGGFLVSIHAPARGATPVIQYKADATSVSIHAPARGATASCGKRSRCPMFQSTRPRGARLRPAASQRRRNAFQSTRPRGARQGRDDNSEATRCFNPRAREGRDVRGVRRERARRPVSIHAPARGATRISSSVIS